VCIEQEENARRSEEFLCKKSLGSELSKSLRRKECTGNRSLYKTKLRGITLQISVSEIQESHFPGGAKVETFGDLENILSLKDQMTSQDFTILGIGSVKE
jgi:hypothetical protein